MAVVELVAQVRLEALRLFLLSHTHPKVGGGRQGSSGHGVAGSLSVCAVFAQEPAELGREPVEHLCVVAVGHDGLTAAGE